MVLTFERSLLSGGPYYRAFTVYNVGLEISDALYFGYSSLSLKCPKITEHFVIYSIQIVHVYFKPNVIYEFSCPDFTQPVPVAEHLDACDWH